MGWDGNIFDPKVIYSAEHARFLMLALGKDATNQDSFIFLAIPKTADPIGEWWVYIYDHHEMPTTDSDSWADYCGLGADTWGVYFTCNIFLWTDSFKYAKLWSIDTNVLSGGSGDYTAMWDLRWNNNSFASDLQPALPHSVAADQATFFVNSFPGGGESVLLWKLTGDRVSSPTLTKATIPAVTYGAIGENVAQPGTLVDLDGGDARVLNAVYHSRRVFVVLTSDISNTGLRSGWLTLKLDVDSNGLDWHHLLASNEGTYFIYPAITTEGAVGGANGNVAVF
jgi:hypothetical protein